MYIDTNRPLFWFADCMNLTEVSAAIHAGTETTKKILLDDGIAIYRRLRGTRFRYYVHREEVRRIIIIHGSEMARKRRLRTSPIKRRGMPLWQPCPYCGKKEKQWKNGLNTAGNREAKCGHCKRCYTIGKRPALLSTCVHCGETTRQYRHQRTSGGNLSVRCGHCRGFYTLKGNPDAPIAPTPEERAALAALISRPWVERIKW